MSVKITPIPQPRAAIVPAANSPFPIRVLPGVALCVAVTLAALALEHAEAALFGRAWLEALVLAILIGTAVRTAWPPGAHWRPGIEFSAKTLLEVAVVLLGASVSAATVLAIGPWMLLGIAGVVADFRKKGVATDYDVVVAERLANVLTGGEADLVDTVTEDQLLKLERQAFLAGVKDSRTQARVEQMLTTGKPLRN